MSRGDKVRRREAEDHEVDSPGVSEASVASDALPDQPGLLRDALGREVAGRGAQLHPLEPPISEEPSPNFDDGLGREAFISGPRRDPVPDLARSGDPFGPFGMAFPGNAPANSGTNSSAVMFFHRYAQVLRSYSVTASGTSLHSVASTNESSTPHASAG